MEKPEIIPDVTVLKGFKSWKHIGISGLAMHKPIDVPFICYSSNFPCVEANAYMQMLITKGNRPTTLKTKADHLRHIIRFIERQPSISMFGQLTDSTFSMFIRGLQSERDNLANRVRINNTILDIARTTIEFLEFVRDFHDLSNFIGTDKSNAILLIENGKKKVTENGAVCWVAKITHASLPSKDAKRRRTPVSAEDAEKVRKHIQGQQNKRKRLRDSACYTAMQQLGARVTELFQIKVSDLEAAKRSGKIEVANSKRQDGVTSRYIPVPMPFITSMNRYLSERAKVIKEIKRNKKRQGKKFVDHDYLFISTTTGKPLQAETWTRYINKIGKAIGVEGKVSPHLWRHAFATYKLIELIMADESINSEDDFRKKYLHTETFKQQLQEWTGHTRLSSLDVYIHLAFAQINGTAEVYSAVSLSNSVDLVEQQIAEIEERIANKELTYTAAMQQFKTLIGAFKSDIEASLTPVNS